jgi:hypothetical protein
MCFDLVHPIVFAIKVKHRPVLYHMATISTLILEMQTQLLSFIMFPQKRYVYLTIRSIMVGHQVTLTPWTIMIFVQLSNSPQCSPAITHLSTNYAQVCSTVVNLASPWLTFYSSLNDYILFNGGQLVDNKLGRWMTEPCPNFRHYLPICVKSLRHTTRSQDNLFRGLDLGLRPPDFERGVLPTQLWSSMNLSAKLSCLFRYVHRILKSDS